MYRFTTVILLVSALFVPMALGQVTGKISGTVTDESGALIPGVEVLVLNSDTGSTRTLVTGDEGRVIVLSHRHLKWSNKRGVGPLHRSIWPACREVGSHANYIRGQAPGI